MNSAEISQWIVILSTDFGRLVFSLIFITWGLVIVNLFLSMLAKVHTVVAQYKSTHLKK